MATLNSKMDILDNHMRLCLKDVSTLQLDVTKFRERLESEVREHTDQTLLKYSQLRLSIKQSTDLLYDVQKLERESAALLARQGGLIETQQASIEDLSKTLVLLKDTKLEQTVFEDNKKELNERIRLLRNLIDDVHNQVESSDNYLEKYLPFNSFCQIFEILRMTLESS
jgi:exonuclease VII large subunit